MTISDLSIRRPVFVAMMSLALVLFGVLAWLFEGAAVNATAVERRPPGAREG